MSVRVAQAVAQCCVATGCGYVVPVVPRMIVIFPGQTEIIDEIAHADYRAVKWLVNLSAGQRNNAFEVYASHNYGASPVFTEYGGVGLNAPHTSTVSIVGANLRYEITNNSANDVYIAFGTRIPVASSSLISAFIGGALFALGEKLVPITKLSALVGPSTTVTLDTISTTCYVAARWLISAYDTTTGEILAVEVYGNRKNASVVTHNVYAKVGPLKKLKVDATLSGSNYLLTIQNTQAVNSVQVYATRIPVLACSTLLCCDCDCGDVFPTPINDVVIPASSTLTVDTVTVASSTSLHWMLVLRNSTTTETRALEVHATRLTTGTTYETHYASIGDTINIDINVVVVGANVELQITNNEVDDLDLDATRFTTGP